MFGIPAVVKKSIRNPVGDYRPILRYYYLDFSVHDGNFQVKLETHYWQKGKNTTNYTLFLQRHNVFPQKNNYLNIPAVNLNSLSNLGFSNVSKDKMKFHNPTPEKNKMYCPKKMKYTR